MGTIEWIMKKAINKIITGFAVLSVTAILLVILLDFVLPALGNNFVERVNHFHVG